MPRKVTFQNVFKPQPVEESIGGAAAQMDSPFMLLFKGFVRQEFRLDSYMTPPRGHRLDLLELLLVHLGDGALTEQHVSHVVCRCTTKIKVQSWTIGKTIHELKFTEFTLKLLKFNNIHKNVNFAFTCY